MPISFNCTSCGKPLKAPDSAAGKPAPCPKCKARNLVPGLAPAAPPADDLALDLPPDIAPAAAKPKPPALTKPAATAPAARQADEPEKPEVVYDAVVLPAKADPYDISPDPAKPAEPPERLRPCPACGEKIPVRAVLCRFCNEHIEPEVKGPGEFRRPQPVAFEDADALTSGEKVLCILFSGIALIVAVFKILRDDSKGKEIAKYAAAAAGVKILLGFGAYGILGPRDPRLDRPVAPPSDEVAKKDQPPAPKPMFEDARRGFQTKLTRKVADPDAPDEPPADLFKLVRYESGENKLAAYVSPPPAGGGKKPAIIWLFGGFSNGIGATAWEPAQPDNDQSASAFRKAGIVMMYPSLRGGCGNPGVKEGLFGEVDDVLAAADWLAKQDYVDPARIYLGGHSTGGTLALLAAAASADRFRAVFSFGPIDEVAAYGSDELPFSTRDEREVDLRAPVRWLHSIRCRTLVMEGSQGNSRSLRTMRDRSTNTLLSFYEIPGANHFSILAPLTELLARKIDADTGPASEIRLADEELVQLSAGLRADTQPKPAVRPPELPVGSALRPAFDLPDMPARRTGTAVVIHAKGGQRYLLTAATLLKADEWAALKKTALQFTAGKVLGECEGPPAVTGKMTADSDLLKPPAPDLAEAVVAFHLPAALPGGAMWLDYDMPAVGDTVWVVGCEAKSPGPERLFHCKVTKVEGAGFAFRPEAPFDTADFAGAPVVSARAVVTGLFVGPRPGQAGEFLALSARAIRERLKPGIVFQ